jgi:two-component system, response regulator PdtaR
MDLVPIRIVVAEDEAIIRLDLVEMLGEEGYDVVGEAGRGDVALSLIRDLKPDLAILDVKMPGIDGLTAAAQIVDEDLCGVIMLTAFSQRELITTASEAGVLAYLVKPFQKPELVAAIEVAAARNAERQALRREVADLTERLEARKVIDRAKAILMADGMSERDAFARIQRDAMNGRTSMRAVAEQLVASRL